MAVVVVIRSRCGRILYNLRLIIRSASQAVSKEIVGIRQTVCLEQSREDLAVVGTRLRVIHNRIKGIGGHRTAAYSGNNPGEHSGKALCGKVPVCL